MPSIKSGEVAQGQGRVPLARALCAWAWVVMAGAACAQEVASSPEVERDAPWWSAPTLQWALRSDAQSNGLPVLDLDGDWRHGYEPSQRTQRAFRNVGVELGVRVASGWSLAWTRRAQGFAKVSPEGAEALRLYQQRADPIAAQRFDVQADVRSWRGEGLSLQAPVWQTQTWRLSARLQWLALDRMRITQADGVVRYSAGGDYDYDAHLMDANPRLVPPFGRPAAQYGQGQSLSFHGQWEPAPHWHLNMLAQDVWSRLRWKGVNVDQSTLTSQVVSRNAQGDLSYRPALSGHYSRRTVSWRMPPTWRMEVHHDEPLWPGLPFTPSVSLQHQWGLSQAWLGVQTPGPWQFNLALEPRSRALQVGVRHGLWSLQWASDRVDQTAHVMQLCLSRQVE
jgi:hypothetical protein